MSNPMLHWIGSRTQAVAVRVGHCSEATVDQEQEVSTAVVRDAVPVSAIPPAASGMHPSHQDSKRPRPDLHPVSEQSLGVDFGSSSAKKRRKNKKKANKEADTHLLRTNLLEANPKIMLIQKDHLPSLKFCFSGSKLIFCRGMYFY
ncbi:hypothetical protein POPTR_014G015400v4 [Populus trichocarpa]|uniref:Uncharacterized protein n=1 Tax=Populus trichocarpa TaxID=3694 RepID=A0ACC0RXM6_POPTR|nr:hypothetical protein POPTR_014G015400v4 [Populus trichocarpa]